MKSMKEKVSVKDDECTVNSSVSVWPVIAACLLKCWHMKNSGFNKAAVRQSGMSSFLSMLSFSSLTHRFVFSSGVWGEELPGNSLQVMRGACRASPADPRLANGRI